MNKKPTYEKLEQRVKDLEEERLKRKNAEETLKYQKDIEHLVLGISADFFSLSFDKIDDGINRTLTKVAKFADAVRSSLFITSEDLTTITNTHEWCADPNDSQIAQLQEIPFDTFGYYSEKLSRFENVAIRRPDDLPLEAHGERDWIKNYGFRSLLFVPLISEKRLYGTVGIYGKIDEDKDWQEPYITLLRLISDIFVRTIESKRARENLETEFRMRTTLLDNIPNCIAMVLKKGTREVVASNRFARELGAVPGLTCFKTCFRRDDSCPFCLAPKLWATDQMQRLEVEYREIWYEGIWAPLSKDLYVHYIFDITERMQAYEKLRDAEASLKNTFDISPGLICVADANAGYFTECNPAVTRILGISVEEFTSKPFMELVHPDDRQRTDDEITKQLRGGTVANFENRYRCKDGSYKWLAWQATAADKNGKVHAVATDITDSKQIQEALGESEEKYRNLFENSKDAVYISSREGLFVDINQAFLDLFGYAKEEVSEMRVQDIYVNPSDRIIFQQEIERNEFVRDYELNFNKKDGEMECLVTATLRFGNDGNILGYQGIIRDITQQKKVESELKSTYERLKMAHDQRRVLSKRLIDLLENDRREIAMELHDQIGQTLTGLKMNLELTHKKLKPDQTELAAQISKAQETTIQVLKDTKNVIYGLRPILIEALGLVPALQELFNATTGIEIHFFTQRIPKRFQVDKELAVYRIVQESLNNMAINYSQPIVLMV